MPQLFANNAASKLAAAITIGATSLTLTTGEGAKFPAITGADNFLVTLVGGTASSETSWEIVNVTARAGDLLTIVRAREGTAAAAWAIDTPVELRNTAGTLTGLTAASGVSSVNSLTGAVTGIATLAGVQTLTNKSLATEVLPIVVNNLPTMRPTLNLNFINSQVLNPRITFTRTSTATRINNQGLIESVLSNTPRISFDPVTLACRGLLIEEQRTNLLTYSEQFDNAAWGGSGLTVTANATTAPDGTLTADKIVAAATLADHARNRVGSTTVSANTLHTISVYAKAAELTQIGLTLTNGAYTSRVSYVFTLVGNGSISSAVLAGTASANSARIENVGLGWYRCSVTCIVDAASTAINHNFTTASGGSAFHTGNAVDGLHLWGAQLEAGAFATSYVPTVATQVTRAADVATMSGENFSSWYRQDEGAFVVDCDYGPATGVLQAAMAATDNSSSNLVHTSRNSSSLVLANVTAGGVAQANMVTSAVSAAAVTKMAYGYKFNDFATSLNGAAVVTDAAGTVPTVDRLALGTRESGAMVLNGHIARMSFYSQRLTNLELQALTTQ